MKKLSILVFLELFISSLALFAFAETYVTWPTMEPDKCASAWLIKRFIDREAVFEFIPKGEFVSRGIPFDTPDSEFRRYHNLSTFESILKKFKIKDPVLLHIGKITHEIEIAYWQETKVEGAEEFKRELVKIIESSTEPQGCFQKSFAFLDQFYQPAGSSEAIVFSSFRAGNWNLWSINESGSDLKQLTATSDEEHFPAISPNRELIAYHTNRGEILLKRSGKVDSQKLVTLKSSFKPVWFPAGEKIAFIRYTFPEGVEDGEIFAVDISEALKEGDLPRPQKLIEEEGIINTLSISPDGKKIAFSLLKRFGQKAIEEIWLRSLDGSSSRKLTLLEAISSEPEWSPDGSKIVFSSNKSGNYDLWLIASDGSSIEQLTSHPSYEGNPSWSPNGEKIVFQSTRGGKMDIWILNLATGESKQITRQGEDNREPAW